MISIAGDDRCYIGASLDIRRRLVTHHYAIVGGTHPMSANAKAAGWANLEYTVLEWARPDKLAEREAAYIEYFGLDSLYNAIGSGRHWSWHGAGGR